MNLIEKVESVLHRRGQRIADLSRGTGIRQNKFTNWRNGDGQPTATQAFTIARWLGVSVDWLLSPDDKQAWPDLSDQERLLIDFLRGQSLPVTVVLQDIVDAQRRRVEAMVASTRVTAEKN